MQPTITWATDVEATSNVMQSWNHCTWRDDLKNIFPVTGLILPKFGCFLALHVIWIPFGIPYPSDGVWRQREPPNHTRPSGCFDCHQNIIWQRRKWKIRSIKISFLYFVDNQYIIHTHHAWPSWIHSNCTQEELGHIVAAWARTIGHDCGSTNPSRVKSRVVISL